MLRRLTIFSLLIFLLAGCSANSEEKGGTEDTLKVYTSIYPLQYTVEQIAGDQATVESIYPPGVDAHTYEPATKEVTAIAEGDVFFYLGAGMESFAGTIKNALELQPITFISIEEENPDLFRSGHEDDGHNHKDLDPHIWLDPERMIAIGEIVRDELAEKSPESKTAFNDRFESFKSEMQELDDSFKNALKDNQHKEILVTHAAYGYWEEQYEIEQIAISGISSSDEPSQKELTTITNIAERDHLEYVIFEKNTSNKVASIVQEHLGAEKLEIHDLEVLTEEDIDNNEDYPSLMKKNLDVLNQATK